MNTIYAMSPEEAAAELRRLQGCANQHLADNLPRPEYVTERDALIDAGVDLELEDDEIVNFVAEEFGMSKADAIDRLARIDFAKARERLAA